MLLLILIVVVLITIAISIWFKQTRWKLYIPNLNKTPTKVIEPNIDRGDYIYYKRNFQRNPFYFPQVPREQLIQPTVPYFPVVDYTDYEFDDMIINNDIRNNIDTQNVHSSLVQKTIQKKFNELVETTPNLNAINEITTFATKMGIEQAKQVELEGILNQIQRRNSTITNLNSTELDTLNKVWFNGTDLVKEQVVLELFDTIDTHGSIVCPTGVVSRIVNCINPEESPRTEAMLRTELLGIASATRKDLESDSSYLALSDADQSKRLKDLLTVKYQEMYSGVLDETDIQKELDGWGL